MKDEKYAVMNENGAVKKEYPMSRKLLPYAVLVILLGLSVFAWRYFENLSVQEAQHRFDRYIDDKVRDITDRLDKYKIILQGGVGVFVASQEVTREEWRDYYEHWQFSTDYPGIWRVSFSKVIQAPELDQHTAEIRAHGFPDYAVWPEGEREEYVPAVFLEPFDEQARRVLGFDLFSDPKRRSAMEWARDTGGAAISEKLELVTMADHANHSGFLMFIPLYQRDLQRKTVEERRAVIEGYVVGAFDLYYLMLGIFAEPMPKIRFRIYDGVGISSANLMYDSHVSPGSLNERPRPVFTATRTLDLYGHQWTLAFETTPAFEAEINTLAARITLAGSTFTSLLIFLILKMMEGTGKRAMSLARQMTRSLRQSEEKLRLVAENMEDVVWLRSEDNSKMLYVSPSYEKIWDRTCQSLYDRPDSFMESVHPKDRPAVDAAYEKYVKSSPFDLEYRIVRSDNDIRWVHARSYPITDDSGQIIGHTGVVSDITERRRAGEEREKLQAQLLQAQKMESIGMLAGGIAHDFNNLLHVMGGNLQLLGKGKPDDHPDKKRIKTIQKSIDRAAHLVRQMLLFSRKADIRTEVLDLNQEIHDAAKLLERSIPRMISIELILDENAWSINADPIQVGQVLLNLGTNAADAMSEGGRLIIETANITLDQDFVRTHNGAKPGKYVLMTVSDTGTGMDPDTLEKIFDPFFTTKEVDKGTGLGLASVYGIVKAHDGYILCYSEPGQGTAFKIYWPAVTFEPGKDQKDSQTRSSLEGGSETILVVDDDNEIRELTSEVLEDSGYQVLSAESGEQALEIFSKKAKDIDLVLMDLNMPGMGGSQCTRKMITLDPSVRILVASGYAANVHGRDVLKFGAKDFISKPFQVNQLLAKVRQVLESE